MGEALTAIHACYDEVGRSMVSGQDERASLEEAVVAGRRLLTGSVSSLHERYPGLVVHEALDEDHAAPVALVRAGASARLVVMGCKGRGGMRALIGSVAQHVLLNVHCPTLVARRLDQEMPA